MAFPATHIIIPMLIVETYRRYISKKKFSRWCVFLAGFFGAAPDFDTIYGYAMTRSIHTAYHRSYTHSFIIPLVAVIVVLTIYLVVKQSKNRKKRNAELMIASNILLVFALGFTCHVLIDGVDGYDTWLYPLNMSFPHTDIIKTKDNAAILDGFLLLIWLLYDEKFFNDILKSLKRLKIGLEKIR